MRIAMLSVHTCPLATLGGKDTGGMNVYVRDLSRELGRRGFFVDVFTWAHQFNSAVFSRFSRGFMIDSINIQDVLSLKWN